MPRPRSACLPAALPALFPLILTRSSHLPPAPPTLSAGYFLTKIFHPNVSASGEICVNVLKRDWKPDLGLRHVLTVIRCLLIEPNAESGGRADGDAGEDASVQVKGRGAQRERERDAPADGVG